MDTEVDYWATRFDRMIENNKHDRQRYDPAYLKELEQEENVSKKDDIPYSEESGSGD